MSKLGKTEENNNSKKKRVSEWNCSQHHAYRMENHVLDHEGWQLGPGVGNTAAAAATATRRAELMRWQHACWWWGGNEWGRGRDESPGLVYGGTGYMLNCRATDSSRLCQETYDLSVSSEVSVTWHNWEASVALQSVK